MNEHNITATVPAGDRGNDSEAAHLAVLRLLAEHPQISQRELSARLGVSLGKVHFVVHALLDKGLVKVRNFQRSQRKLAYAYVLTPSGMRAKLSLTRRFLQRKEVEFESLQKTIALLRRELDAADPGAASVPRLNGPDTAS